MHAAPAFPPSDGLFVEYENVTASHFAEAAGCGAFFGLFATFPQFSAMHASWHVAFARQPWHASDSFGQMVLQVDYATPHFVTFAQTSSHVTVATGAETT